MRWIVLLALALPAAAQSFQQGRALLQQKKFEEAVEVYRALTKAQPNNAFAWYYLGYALHAAGRFDEALPIHVRAAQYPVVAPSASYNAACVHARQGRADDALAWLEKAWRAGFRDVAGARKDADLAKVREDARFDALLERLQAELVPFHDGTKVLHEWVGEQPGGQFGWVAGNAGDVDNDGVSDIVVGAPTVRVKGQPCGKVYVYSGKSGNKLFEVAGRPGDQLGNAVDTAGDVDGDGHADVLGGAPASAAVGPGSVYVVSGKDGSLLFRLDGENKGDRFGMEVGSDGGKILVGAPSHGGKGRVYLFAGKKRVATYDGERAGDSFGRAAALRAGLVVVGAPKAGPSGKGRAYVYRGDELAFVLDADATAGALGEMFVSIPGDCDGDGAPDVYVSDWKNNGSNGRIYVVSGKDGSVLRTHTGARKEGFGIGKAEAGDCNGDGCVDLIVGAWQSADGAPSGGKAYLISGKDGKTLKTYTCRAQGDTFGFDATGLGDVDGDGAPDFLITSAWSSVAGLKSGRVFVVSGALE